jgi:cell wall-associated NlpC family hydrolase
MNARTRVLGVAALAASFLLPAPAHAAPTPAPSDGPVPVASLPDPLAGVRHPSAELVDLVHRQQGVTGQLAAAQFAVQQAQARLEETDRATGAVREAAERAARAAEDARGRLSGYVQALYTDQTAPSGFGVLFAGHDPAETLEGLGYLTYVGQRQAEVVNAAVAAEQHAAGLAAAAEQTLAAAHRQATATQDQVLRLTRLATTVNEQLTDALGRLDLPVELTPEQRARNAAVAAAWRDYTAKLAAARLTPPAAAALRDPARLPRGLTAVRGADKKPEAGVAQAKGLLVLPAETVAALDLAVHALGRPYSPGVAGPAMFDCGGLVRAGYGAVRVALPADPAGQWSVLAPVPAKNALIGDLVYLGPGVQHVGVVLDAHTMVAADALTGAVVATDIPARDVVGYARPMLPHRRAASPPARAAGAPRLVCGAPPSSGGAAGAWGGYPNGLIPAGALCPIGVAAHRLRCDAARAWQAMARAYGTAFGTPMCISDSYRSFAEQVSLYAVKPSLAAVPGTSNHGWGLAVDLCGGIEHYGTAQYAWMKAYAPRFGWVHPSWAEPGRGREEPWHWEFV